MPRADIRGRSLSGLGSDSLGVSMSEPVYEGRAIRIRFDGDKCIHSRNCVLTLPQVFRANVPGAWIDPDAASAEAIAALAHRCPSGVITYERLDGQPGEEPSRRNVVAVQENGPYAVRGTLEVGGKAETPRLTLCRCGASRRKPYCDHSHAQAGFTATGEVSPADDPGTITASGPLHVNPLNDGPLMLVGPVEITAGSGRTVQRTEKCFLCRCGGSARKPFCDGSHRAIGFKSS